MKGAAALSLVAPLVACACSLSNGGLLDSSVVYDASIAPSDASPAGDASGGEPGDADGPSDADDATAQGDSDGSPDVADATPVDACGVPLVATNEVKATQATPPPTIDGNLADWPCPIWYALDESNASYVQDGGGSFSALFALEYDVGHVYVAWRVSDANVAGDNTVNPYLNDSVEIYISGDSSPNGDYDDESHNYVVDHNNLCVDYGPTQEVPQQPQLQSPPNVTSAVQVVPGVGFNVEMSIAVAAIGQAELEPGTSLFFDTQINTGDGVTQGTVLLWALVNHGACGCIDVPCCCNRSPDLPYCDTERLGKLSLQ